MVQRNNIHKRKDGRREQRYKNGFRENRSIKCRSVYASSCAECEKELVSVYADEKTPSEICDDSKCFCDILDAWICTNRIRIKGATEAKYVRLIETHISPELGAMKLHELNAGVINRFLDAKTHAGGLHNGAPLSASYVRTMAVIIEAALRYASAEGWCPPLKSPIYKPAVSKKAVDILSKNAAATLVKQLSDDLSPTAIGIFLALCGGLRIGEVCALQWQDVDFAANLIHVRHTISRVPGHHTAQKTQLVLGAPKTASSLRDIPIPSLLRNALLKVYQNRCSSFVIFDGVERIAVIAFFPCKVFFLATGVNNNSTDFF